MASMERKTFPAIVIKVDTDRGMVEHIVAVMGNMDGGNDRIMPGAFTKTIAERAGKIRCLDQHQTDSVMRVLGRPMSMREIGRGELPIDIQAQYPDALGGLLVETQFNQDTQNGREAFALIKAGDVAEWSIGYEPLDVGFSKVVIDGKPVTCRDLKTLRLWEYSPVIWGMNPATATVSAKEAEMEAKPYANEHACRLRDPDEFQGDSFRRTTRRSDGKKYAIIMGRVKGEDTMTEQAYRYPKDEWDEETAASHCRDHDGTFEAASKEMTPWGPVRRMGDVLKAAVHTAVMSRCDNWLEQGMVSGDEHKAVMDACPQMLGMMESMMPIELMVRELPLPSGMFDIFLGAAGPDGLKAGRILSSASAQEIEEAMDSMMAAMDKLKRLMARAMGDMMNDDKAAPRGAAVRNSYLGTEAGPDLPPTSRAAMVAAIETELIGLQLLEVRT